MAIISFDIPEEKAYWGTSGHRNETLRGRSVDGVPYQMNWGDLNPGKKIRPAGSPLVPDGLKSKEVNWENTMGGQFWLALKRLEGLMYAVYGARPTDHINHGQGPATFNTWTKAQWYRRKNPRCMWGAEMWQERFWTLDPDHKDFVIWDSLEYAALGESFRPLGPLPRYGIPAVPVRSRTDDVRHAVRRKKRNKRYFPDVADVDPKKLPSGAKRPGIWLAHGGRMDEDGLAETDFGADHQLLYLWEYDADASEILTYDPLGSGWFGSIDPGNQGASNLEIWAATWNDPGVKTDQQLRAEWKNGNHFFEGGYMPGESVRFIYQPPTGDDAPTHAYIHWRPEAGAEGWNSSQMTLAGGRYTFELPAQEHGTEILWYVRYRHVPVVGPDVISYSPHSGDETMPPDDADTYSVTWFTHFVKYPHGFPELQNDYYDKRRRDNFDIRQSTDSYQFTPDETIQPELLNMARYVLSALGKSTCQSKGNATSGCDEMPSSTHAVHPPQLRTESNICCVDMPITWRWSGSNVHPHYVFGGKGERTLDEEGIDDEFSNRLDTRPLHDSPKEPAHGSELARKSWRGIENLFDHGTTFRQPVAGFRNDQYGGGVSWGTAPGMWQRVERTWQLGAFFRARFDDVGLQPGDVIDPIHIQEIIDAVKYLIDYGVWTKINNLPTFKKTPGGDMQSTGSYLGIGCSWGYGWGGSNASQQQFTGNCNEYASAGNCDACPCTDPGGFDDFEFNTNYSHLHGADEGFMCCIVDDTLEEAGLQDYCCGYINDTCSPVHVTTTRTPNGFVDGWWSTGSQGRCPGNNEGEPVNAKRSYNSCKACRRFKVPNKQDCADAFLGSWNKYGDKRLGECRMSAKRTCSCSGANPTHPDNVPNPCTLEFQNTWGCNEGVNCAKIDDDVECDTTWDMCGRHTDNLLCEALECDDDEPGGGGGGAGRNDITDSMPPGGDDGSRSRPLPGGFTPDIEGDIPDICHIVPPATYQRDCLRCALGISYWVCGPQPYLRNGWPNRKEDYINCWAQLQDCTEVPLVTPTHGNRFHKNRWAHAIGIGAGDPHPDDRADSGPPSGNIYGRIYKCDVEGLQESGGAFDVVQNLDFGDIAAVSWDGLAARRWYRGCTGSIPFDATSQGGHPFRNCNSCPGVSSEVRELPPGIGAFGHFGAVDTDVLSPTFGERFPLCYKYRRAACSPI